MGSALSDDLVIAGSGDAFTASLISGFLRSLQREAINRHANAVAPRVCSQNGAMPPLSIDLRQFQTDP